MASDILVNIGSGNGLESVGHPAITLTNADFSPHDPDEKTS